MTRRGSRQMHVQVAEPHDARRVHDSRTGGKGSVAAIAGPLRDDIGLPTMWPSTSQGERFILCQC